MSEARCFNCLKLLGIGKTMEELIRDKFPVFCSAKCAASFPNNWAPEFNKRINEIKQGLKINVGCGGLKND